MTRPYEFARRVLRSMRDEDDTWFVRRDRHVLAVQVFALASDREWRTVRAEVQL